MINIVVSWMIWYFCKIYCKHQLYFFGFLCRVLVDSQTREGVELILSCFTYEPDKMRALQILGTVPCFELLLFLRRIVLFCESLGHSNKCNRLYTWKWHCWPVAGTIRRFWPDSCRRTSRVCSSWRIVHPESPLGASSLRFCGVSEDLATSELPKDITRERIIPCNFIIVIVRIFTRFYWLLDGWSCWPLKVQFFLLSSTCKYLSRQ